MNIYLAGPMRGHEELNFPAFRKAAAELRTRGHFVFNPADGSPVDADIRECMSVDVNWICNHADAVALLPGWEHSLGAKAEKALADALRIDVIYL